jgi:undecaprenyl-diphosphatase
MGVTIAGVLLILFFAIMHDLLTAGPLVSVDSRVISQVQLLRSPTLNHLMVFVTYLGNWQLVVSGAALVAIFLGLSSRWLSVAVLVVSLAGGELLVSAIKYLINRPRPDLANALVLAQGPSFPSGHAFVAFSLYGLVAWFVAERSKTSGQRLLLVSLAVLWISALGFSRIYLGAHWPSDVLASFALGASWLTVVLAGLNIGRARGLEADSRWRTMLPPRVVAGGLAAIWIGIACVFFVSHPLIEQTPVAVAPRPLSVEARPTFLAITNISSHLAGD